MMERSAIDDGVGLERCDSAARACTARLLRRIEVAPRGRLRCENFRVAGSEWKEQFLIQEPAHSLVLSTAA
jgi:hypothetical protein